MVNGDNKLLTGENDGDWSILVRQIIVGGTGKGADEAHAGLTFGEAHCSVTLVRRVQPPQPFTLLVDCGAANDRQQLLEALQQNGVQSPDDVTHLVITHFHFDHCGNIALFPNAQLITPDDLTISAHSVLIHDDVCVKLYRGHSDGDLAVFINQKHTQSEGLTRRVSIVGDLFEREGDWQGEQLVWRSISNDADAQLLSRLNIWKRSDVIVPGHGAAFPTNTFWPNIDDIQELPRTDQSTTNVDTVDDHRCKFKVKKLLSHLGSDGKRRNSYLIYAQNSSIGSGSNSDDEFDDEENNESDYDESNDSEDEENNESNDDEEEDDNKEENTEEQAFSSTSNLAPSPPRSKMCVRKVVVIESGQRTQYQPTQKRSKMTARKVVVVESVRSVQSARKSCGVGPLPRLQLATKMATCPAPKNRFLQTSYKSLQSAVDSMEEDMSLSQNKRPRVGCFYCRQVILVNTGGPKMGDKLIHALEHFGKTPADVTHVIYSSLHRDNIANASLFRSAITYMARDIGLPLIGRTMSAKIERFFHLINPMISVWRDCDPLSREGRCSVVIRQPCDDDKDMLTDESSSSIDSNPSSTKTSLISDQVEEFILHSLGVRVDGDAENSALVGNVQFYPCTIALAQK